MPKVNLPVCIPSCMTSSMTTTSSVLQPPTRLGTWCPFTMEVPDLYRTTWCHYPPRHRPTTTSNKTRTAATTALRAPILDVSQICSLYTVTQKRTMGIFSCNSSKHCLTMPIPWGHSGPLCRALSLSSSSWTSMRRRRATRQ